MVVLLSFTAIVVDGGLLLDQRQRVQAAADMAALAAADKLYVNFPTYQGLDTPGTATAAALASAAANGYPNATVNIPPLSGPFAGMPGYAEVIITYNQTRYFSKMFGSSDIPVVARAVSQGRWAAIKAGVMVLDPSSSGALTSTGSGAMAVAGVPMLINSNSPTAAVATGGGNFVSPEFDIAGVPGIGGSGSWSGTVYSGQPPTPDPLAYLPEPDPSTMVLQSSNPTHISGISATTINPGVYRGGITVTGQGLLTMAPGIYYMDGGGFSFSGQGGLNAAGVMIVNAPKSNSDNISINGNGAINFSPLTTGIYQGIALWQVRSASNTVYVTGNGASSMSGTFYVPGGTLNVSGNGTGDVIGSQYISYDLTINGGGNFGVNWTVSQSAKTRIIILVE
jgi:hypothetical protein